MTNIEVSENTYQMLLEIKNPDQTIDDVITLLLDEYFEDLNEKSNEVKNNSEYDDIIY